MAEASLKLGTDWAVKEDYLLGYNDENGNYKPIPFDFSRASIGTRVNRDGLIEVVQDNIPRIDFSSGEGSLLLEPQRTNSLLQSNQFDTTWVNTNSTETGGQSGVGGSNDAWLLSKSGLNGRLDQTISASGVLTFSIYAKANALNWIYIRIDGSGGNHDVYFDLVNGVAGINNLLIDSDIQSVGNGYYRCSMSFNDTISVVRIYPADADGNTSGTSGSIYIQNAQLEAGSYSTSLIPTSGSAVTRVAEGCVSNEDASLFNDSEGTLFLEIKGISNGGSSRRFSITSGNVNNRVSLELDETASLVKAFMSSNGTLTGTLEVSNITQTDTHKIALTYTSSAFKIFIDGILEDTDTSIVGSPIGLDTLQFTSSNDTLPMEGFVKQAFVFKTALTDSECIALTTL